MTPEPAMPAARRFALLAALCATAAASAAPVWRYPIDSAAPVDLAVERAAVNANGTLWAFGTLAQDRALVRYATATTPDIVIPLGYFDFVPKSLVADADGGALLVGYRGAPDDSGDGSVDCHLLYVDATGRRRWETTTNPSCDALTTFPVPPPTQPDTAGERWVHLGAELVRVGGDGRILSKIPYFELAGEVVAADARSGALYLVAIETANDLRTPVVIAQDKRGVERWRWRGTEFAASGFQQRTTLAADGSLRIAIANERGLFLVRLDADGQQRWSRKTDEPNGDGGPFVDLDTPQTDASGATWLATAGADPTRAMLRRISAAGDVVTSRTFAEAGIGERGATIAARAAPDGDLVVANGASVVRLASDGGVRYARVPGGGDVVEVRLVGFDAAGAVLATARSSTTGTSFVRLDRSGVELPAPSPRGVHSDATRTNRALLADGSIAVWTRGLIGGSRELLRVSADGTAQWRRATPGVWSKSQDVRAGAVAAGGDRVCTLDSQQREATREHFVDCYRAADGTPLWSRPIGVTDGVSANGLARLSVDGNGAVSAWYGAPGLPWETTQVRIDANGTVVAAKTFDGFTLADGVSNDAPYVVLLSNTEVAVAERGGTERYRWPRGTPAGVPSFGIGADATLVVAERSASTSDVVVTATDPTGRTRWTRTLDAKSGRPAAVAVTATSVFVGTCCVETSPGKPVRDIAALSLADGATRWRRAAARRCDERLSAATRRDAGRRRRRRNRHVAQRDHDRSSRRSHRQRAREPSRRLPRPRLRRRRTADRRRPHASRRQRLRRPVVAPRVATADVGADAPRPARHRRRMVVAVRERRRLRARLPARFAHAVHAVVHVLAGRRQRSGRTALVCGAGRGGGERDRSRTADHRKHRRRVRRRPFGHADDRRHRDAVFYRLQQWYFALSLQRRSQRRCHRHDHALAPVAGHAELHPRRRQYADAHRCTGERLRCAHERLVVRTGDLGPGHATDGATGRHLLRTVVHVRPRRCRRRSRQATLVHDPGFARRCAGRRCHPADRADHRRCVRQRADEQYVRGRFRDDHDARLRSREGRLPLRRQRAGRGDAQSIGIDRSRQGRRLHGPMTHARTMPKHSMQPRRPLATALVGIALLAASHATQAWDWSRTIVGIESVDFQPMRAAIDTRGELWAEGTNSNAGVFVHYRSDGTHRATPLPASFPASSAELVAGADGSIVAVAPNYDEKCDVIKAFPDGRVAWHQAITSCTQSARHPLRLWPADAAGGHWLASDRTLIRFGNDGRVTARIEHTQGEPGEISADAGTGRIYRVLVTGSDTALVAHDVAGRELWRRAAGALGATRLSAVTVAADGSLRVIGAEGNGAVTLSLDAAGALRWRHAVPEMLAPDARSWAPVVARDGAAWFFVGEDGSDFRKPVVVRMTASGQRTATLLRDALVPENGELGVVENIGAAANGDLVITKASTAMRFSTTGEARMRTSLVPPLPQIRNLRIVHLHEDGSLLLLASLWQQPARLVRLAADGGVTIVDTPLTDAPGEAATQTVASDGSTVAIATTFDGTRQLLRIDTSGVAVWQRALPHAPESNLTDGLVMAAVAERAGRICTLGASGTTTDTEWSVRCHDAATGAETWSRALERVNGPQTFPPTAHLVFDATGALLARYETTDAGGTHIVTFARLSGTGEILSTKPWRNAYVVPGGSHGNAFALLASGSQFAVAGPDGNERYRIEPPTEASLTAYALADDGGAVLAWREGPPSTATAVVRRHTATGAMSWRVTVGDMYEAQNVALGGDAAYVVGCCRPDANSREPTRSLVAFALADGSVRWRNETTASNAYSTHAAVTPSNAQVVVTSTTMTLRNVVVRIVDAADGRTLSETRQPCPGASCSLRAAPIIAGGRLHAVLQGDSAESALAAWTLPVSQEARVRADQPGLAGAWWAPYANGEGFVLDYLPDSRTLFMPWFTFSQGGGNDPAGQRWYVVQGAVPANATEVELPITETTGGAFDAGPSITPAIVGIATLTFTDCDNGVLRYRFLGGHNAGATGAITLSRLSPATQNCILADGSTQTRTVAPANGFDARMSGSWFEPATSGQGMQLTVQPGGIFFAPWFTFDPAGASDDPGKQRWFTIQGSLAGARNGVATLPIVQTIGGAFDSVPTNNMYSVGSATITMLACDRAKVDYRYDDNDLAAAMRNRSGSIDLVKAGGCGR
jgi:hypothetical protein